MARTRVEAFLLCDSVVVDQQTGKTTVQGVFDQVFRDSYPGGHPNITIYARFSVSQASSDVDIEIRTPSGKTDRLPSQKVAPRIGIEVVQFMVQVPVLPLPEPGKYELSLFIDGETAATFRFTAMPTGSAKPASV